MRIVSIDFFRFLFMTQVCLWHLSSCMGIMKHGYIAVEFFFILSGYLLYKSSTKEKALGVFEYTWDKIQRFYPEVLIVTLPATIVYFVGYGPNLIPLFNSIFFLQNTGIYSGGGVNLSLWYLNVLLLGGGIVYAIIHNNRHLALTVVFPLIILFVYTYILKVNNGSLELFGTKLCFYIPLWRGIAGISLGCLLARLYEIKLKNPVQGMTRILDVLSLMSIVGSFVIVFATNHGDSYALFFYSIIILSCFTSGTFVNRLLNHSIWSYLGKLSFEMLLVHMPIAQVFLKVYSMWKIPVFVFVISYVLFVLLSSILLKGLNEKLSNTAIKH